MQNPLDQPAPPLLNPDNAILDSPLSGTLTTAQPMSYSVPVSWSLSLPLATLPVYTIARMPVTGTELLAVAHRIGVQSLLTAPQQSADGGVVATVQIDDALYTLTVYAGYGTPRFTLQAMQPAIGILSSARVLTQATAWLQDHNLQSPDLHPLVVGDGGIDYGQNLDGSVPLLGPITLHLDFDSRGRLRDLSDAYVAPYAVKQWPVDPPAIAAAPALGGQGLYQGPPATVITGSAAITGITLAYVGVHGAVDYLEPIYVLSGTVPTTTGPAPFSLYVSALQYTATN